VFLPSETKNIPANAAIKKSLRVNDSENDLQIIQKIAYS
jgi:hypothetical protein